MEIIEAALAFALTMLVLSMIASTFVEMIHRAFALREDGLRYLLGQFFDQVLAHYTVRAGVPAEKAVLEAMRTEFQERMTENRTPIGLVRASTGVLPVPAELDPAPPRGSKVWNFIQQVIVGRMSRGRKLGNVPLNVFMERLGSDHFGDKIVQATGATAAGALDAVLQDVAQKYENFGKDASEVFSRRARVLSVLVAIVLAFWMHVDAFELFTTFMRDPATRNAMIDKQAEYSKKFEGALRPPGTTAPANPPRQTTVIEATLQLAPQGATASPPVNPGQQVPPQVRELQDQYARAITELKDAQTQLVTLGVPIGWTQERRQAANMVSIFWTCRIDDPRSTERSWFGSCDAGRMNVWFGLPTNPGVILSLIVGGLLIGLGGPFWHDAVRSLTNIRSLARSAGADSGTAAAAAIAGGVGQPKTPVDVFKIANSARAVASPGSGSRARPLLNPDGTDG